VRFFVKMVINVRVFCQYGKECAVLCQNGNKCAGFYVNMAKNVWKIRSRRQRTDIGKYSFVNRTIQDWNQLPAEVLGTLPCKLKTLKKRVRKAIIEVS